jgi:hypothetical protein
LAAQARTLRGAGWTLTPAAQAILKGAAPDQVLAKFGQNVTTADGTGGIGVLAYGSGKAVPALPAVGGATTGTAASLRTSRSLQSARRAAGSIWEYLYCITHETAYIEGSSGVGGVSDEWLLHNSSTQGDKDITPGGFYTCTAANAPCIVFGDWNPTFPWEVEAGRFVGTASVAIISGWCTHN